jgi:hypothetical protein
VLSMTSTAVVALLTPLMVRLTGLRVLEVRD